MTEAQKILRAAAKSRQPVLSKAVREQMKAIQGDPGKAKAFLVAAGINTKGGKLTAAFRKEQ